MTMKRLSLLLLLSCCFLTAAVCVFSKQANATITNYISFQGKLTNPDGTNVTNNSYTIVFSIYTVSSGGSAVWTESKSVTVTDGLFQTNLGDTTTLPGSVNFNSNALYLGVKVGADAEMTPRVQLTAVPQAFNAENLGGIASSGYVQLSPGAQQTGNINVSGTITSGAVNGITVGSTIQPSASGTLTVQSNGSNALTLTGGAASTWSTTAGLLTVQGFGGLALNTPATNSASTPSTNINITTGNANGTTSGSGSITIDVGTATGSLGTITIGHAGVTTTVSGSLTVTQGLTASAGLTVAANQDLTLTSGTGTFVQTFSNSAADSAQTLSVTNSNSGASSIAINGHDITLVGTATSGGTNTNSAFKFENPSAAANNVFYGLNFAGTGYTDILRVNGNQIIDGSGVLKSAGLSGTYSNALTLSNASNSYSGTFGGLTLASQTDGFTAAGGTTSRTLTVTGANITVGSTIQPTAAGALIVRSNGSNALTLTGGAASTWDIGANTLSLQTTNNGAITLGTGLLTLGGNATFSGTSARTITGPSTGGLTVTVASGPLSLSTTTSGTLAVTSAGALNLTGAAASTFDVGANTLSLQTTNNGAITTGTGTLTQGGNITFSGTSARTLTGPSTGGLTVTVASGPLTISTTTSGTLAITSAGALNLTGAAASTFDIGNNTLSLQTTNNGAITTGTGLLTQGGNITFSGTSARTITGPGTGGLTVNVTAGPLTISTTTSGLLTLQGAGGIAITAGTSNITIGAVDGTANLLILDSKNTSGDPTGVKGGEYYNSNNNKFRCFQNAAWADCTNGFTNLTRTSDQAATQSTTTCASDTVMQFSAAANTTYFIDAFIYVDESNTTADLKYCMTAPASSTLAVFGSASNTAGSAPTSCVISAIGGSCAVTTVNPATGFIKLNGVVRTAGTAGTVAFQFAQNGAVAASFPVIKSGSIFSYRTAP